MSYLFTLTWDAAPKRILNWIKNQNMATLRRTDRPLSKHKRRKIINKVKRNIFATVFFVSFVTNCKFVCQKVSNMQSVYWRFSDVLKWKNNTIDIAAFSIRDDSLLGFRGIYEGKIQTALELGNYVTVTISCSKNLEQYLKT